MNAATSNTSDILKTPSISPKKLPIKISPSKTPTRFKFEEILITDSDSSDEEFVINTIHAKAERYTLKDL